MTVRDFYQVISSNNTVWINAGDDAERFYPEQIPRHLFNRQIIYMTTDAAGDIVIELGE